MMKRPPADTASANLPAPPPDYATLKTRHRAVRDGYPPDLNLRLHRALSWLNRAEQCDDHDGRYIFLWIAFNAAYAREIDSRAGLSEQAAFMEFLRRTLALDTEKRFDELLWRIFPGPIRTLLDNPYVLQPFWDYHAGRIDETAWQERMARDKKRAFQALSQGDTLTLLAVVFHRLYTLRNQLVHGGATWNSQVNRAQLKDCTQLLSHLLVQVLSVMLEHPEADWGPACYPVV